MKPQIEDLRKKAFMLYQGPEGVKRVQREVGRMGVPEDDLTDEQVNTCLNNIIKHVFIDLVGLEKTKSILSKEVKHIPGYHPPEEEIREKVSIFERVNFMKWFVIFIALLFIALVGFTLYYSFTFDRAEACDQKKSDEARDQCFLTVAYTRLNDSICDKLSSQEKAYKCIHSVGIDSNTSSICDRIPGGDISEIDLHDKCRLCVAFNRGNKSLCTGFYTPAKTAECEDQIGRGYSLICGARR